MVAISGGGALAAALLTALLDATPGPARLLWLVVGRAVLTPYWWHVESRIFLPPGPAPRAGFLAQQALSRHVWLGGLAALAPLLR